jgi:hypothetical protein
VRGFAAVVAAAIACTVVGTAPVHAVTDSPVPVQIERLSPIVPSPDEQLRISGRVLNTTLGAFRDVQARLRISSGPLTERAAIVEVAATPFAPETEPASQILDSTRVDVTPQLDSGAQGEFAFTLDVESLPLPDDGVYVLAVELVGVDAESGGAEQVIGIERTFLPWFPDPEAITPVDVVWLWPLADWPAREATGVLLDDRTPEEISPGGRLDRLLAIGARYPRMVTWIADPALLRTVQEMAGGYEVQRSTGVVAGDRSAEAARWLEVLSETLRTARSAADPDGPLPIRVLPYADVDAVALTRAGMQTDVVRSVTRSAPTATTVLGGPVLGSVAWLPFGRVDDATAATLVSAGVEALVLGGFAMPAIDDSPNTGRARMATSVGNAEVLLLDPSVSTTLMLPQQSRSQSVTVRQRFLAQTAMVAQEFGDASTRTVIVGPRTPIWDPSEATLVGLLRATMRAPWMRPQTLTTLFEEGTIGAPRTMAGYGQKARAAELPASYLRRVQRASAQLATLTAILNNPAGITDAYSSALLRAESAAWRSDPATGRALLDSITAQLREQTGLVRVLSEGRVTFSGDSGSVPVTIANDLDRAVTVGVELVASPTPRLESDPVQGIVIDPGKKVSVEIDARVIGGRSLPVRVQLLTPDGQDYGQPATIELASTAYARAASWVVIVAFVAIAIFVVVGITRRIRRARRGHTVPTSDKGARPSDTV